MAKTSAEICVELRRYQKEKGWPLAHEAADKIEELEKKLADLTAGFELVSKHAAEARSRHLEYALSQLKP